MERPLRDGAHLGLFVGTSPKVQSAIDRLRDRQLAPRVFTDDASTVNSVVATAENKFVKSTAALALASAGKGDPEKIAEAGFSRATALLDLQREAPTAFVAWELSEAAVHSPLRPQHTDGE